MQILPNASKGVGVAKCDSIILFVLQMVKKRDISRAESKVREFCVTSRSNELIINH